MTEQQLERLSPLALEIVAIDRRLASATRADVADFATIRELKARRRHLGSAAAARFTPTTGPRSA